ncbi:CinA family protein [Butyrivibrio sp. JL13D10]|uniref:CinA family protein n=1 Tax=Butyrivibrio sp. JL13D10 TaxID=3236815 RepID=UPI0038B5BEE5
MINEISVIKKYEKITKYLIKKKLTISTMESCTAGMVASFLTDTEGSSATLKGAYITYSNEAKIKQGVPADVIQKNGVYSPQTALAMATACMDSYNADIGIGVTGTLGNTDPDNADSVPGEVHLGLIYPASYHSKISTDTCNPKTSADICRTTSFTLPPASSRHEYKLIVADLIADEIIKNLIE